MEKQIIRLINSLWCFAFQCSKDYTFTLLPSSPLYVTLFLLAAMYGGWFDYNKEFLKASADRGNQIIVLQFEKLKKVRERTGIKIHLSVFSNVKKDNYNKNSVDFRTA